MHYNEFLDAGYRVFGLHPIVGDACGCGNPDCKAVGKHPCVGSWQTVPMWSQEQLDIMEQLGHFDTGYGVNCRGLIVIDIDARNGGLASFERLTERVPEIAGAGLIVATGSGGGSRHMYFKAPEGVALMTGLRDYPGIDFKSGAGAYVVGPGSAHLSGGSYTIGVGTVDDIDDAPAGLIELIRRPATIRVEYDGHTLDVSQEDVASMLQSIPNADLPYEDFIQIGMAVHHATGGTGFDLWDKWAATSAKYDPAQMGYWWHHFRTTGQVVTVGTLIHHAMLNGWVRPVTLEPVVPETKDDILDLSDIDLRRPPGFVGEVTEWIASQPRRPRDNIAVGAALAAVGNHIGLRMIDERDGVTGNLIIFNVAASATGKEAVQQAFNELHRTTGISQALHGNIKSDAEIYRNLIRHQAAFYNTDEVSDFLEKLNNAKKKGGAAYLEGVIATIMSIYTKANGYALLTGDAKEELKNAVLARVARLRKEKELDDDETDYEVEALLGKVAEIDKGIKNPFLSMCGYGTNDKFTALMDFRGATEGFFGRAMVFMEQETAPRLKRGYKRKDLPDHIKNTLSRLYYGGSYDAAKTRVEWEWERVKVPTAKEASDLLDQIAEMMDDKALEHKEKSGLEAMWLRAYELVSKVSFVLAAPHGLRTVEHVRWALKLVMSDIERKTQLVVSNDRKLDAPQLALMARLKSMLGDDYETQGVIVSRCRGHKKEDVIALLDNMVLAGHLEVLESKHPKNGATVKKYRAKK